MPDQPPAQQPHNRPPFPGVRLAEPRDRAELFDLFMLAYRENGFGGIDQDEVRDVIAKATRHESYAIAVIQGREHIEAVIGLQPSRNWYGDAASWYYTDLLLYVRPEHRRSRHFAKLMAFAKWFEDVAQAPVILGLMPVKDYDRKRRLFERYGRDVSTSYLIGSGQFRYMQPQAEAA